MKKLLTAVAAAGVLAAGFAQPALALSDANEKTLENARHMTCAEVRKSYDPAIYKTRLDIINNAQAVAAAAKSPEIKEFYLKLGEISANRAVECGLVSPIGPISGNTGSFGGSSFSS